MLFGGGSSVTIPVPLLEQFSLGVPPFISLTCISKALQCVLRKVLLLHCTCKDLIIKARLSLVSL